MNINIKRKIIYQISTKDFSINILVIQITNGYILELWIMHPNTMSGLMLTTFSVKPKKRTDSVEVSHTCCFGWSISWKNHEELLVQFSLEMFWRVIALHVHVEHFFHLKLHKIYDAKYFLKTRSRSPFSNHALSSSETIRSGTCGIDFVPQGWREIIMKRAVKMSLNTKKYLTFPI